MNKCTKLLFLSLLLLTFVGCNSYKKIVYFQDLQQSYSKEITREHELCFKPNDQIYIFVSSNKDPELAAPFNLSSVSYRSGSNIESGYGSYINQYYTVDARGTIQFPILGTLLVAGKSRTGLQDTISSMLKQRNLLKDPIVNVLYSNFKISVMGEVARPGSYPINSDQITLLDALSMAGDLTIYGKRTNLTVIRERDGKREAGRVDLCSQNLFDSPYYYLQQNDVVYVEPNRQRTDQSQINQNNNVGTWVSILSFLSTLVFFVVSR